MNNEAPQNDSKLSNVEKALAGILIIMVCGGLCGVAAVFLLRRETPQRLVALLPTAPGNVNVSMTQAGSVPRPTATWIPTSPVLEAIPTAVSTKDVNSLKVKAKSRMQQGDYGQALPLWDEIVAEQPEEAEGYYQRALCYYNLLPQEHNFETYELYIRSALKDMDAAISLQPDNGDYYAFRHDVFSELEGIVVYRVDRQAITRVAHENAAAAITLGYTEDYRFTDRVYVADLTSLEQCEQSLKTIEDMIRATSPDDSSITGLYRMGAEALACQGRYDEAVHAVSNSLYNSNNAIMKTYLKGLYLYQLGKLDEALEVINASLVDQPTFQGYRYYLRALIYYDQGKPDLAKADLETGSFYTWERSSLYAYVQGRLALDAGDKAEGIEQLQLAEASMDHNCMLIRSRIVKQLAKLGAEPLSLTPTVNVASTPIPIGQP